MKKCASCSKDLPDAALHCVFCGAKQPPAPATAGGLAKTVMGSYSANDVMEQLKGQQPGRPTAPMPNAAPVGPARNAPPYGGSAPAPSPYQRPFPAAPGPSPAYPPPAAPRPTNQPGPTLPSGPPAGHRVPAASHEARTMFVGGPGAAPPQGGFGGPGPGPGGFGGPGGPGPGGFGAPNPGGFGAPGPGGFGGPGGPNAGAYNAGMGPGAGPGPMPYSPPVQPMAGMPMAPMPAPLGQPYLASQTGRSGRPIEPWRDSLRLMMFIWGGALLLVFVTPLTVEPYAFNWDTILHVDGKAKLPPLVMAAIGLLSIVLALIPTSPVPRGLIAGALGLAGIALPLVLDEVTAWQALVPGVGLLLLIPGLLIREEYRESLLARGMVTLGVIAVLLPLLLPENSRLPIVDLFKQAIDQPGKAKVIPLLEIGRIVIVVLALLAWLPAPASGGAKVFAWILLLWPAVTLLTTLILADQIADAVTKTPAVVVAWAVGTAYAVLVGYGFATVIGKKLE